jgi:beta-lactamase superfamily II metal-dependent hydrolase
MNRPSLLVLDVGHGNAAVLLDTGGVIVIDAGKGGLIIDVLLQLQIDEVDILLISHSDEDHVGSAPHLLLEPKIMVRTVYFNSDPSKNSRSWAAFSKAIGIARIEKNLEAHAELTTTLTGSLDRGEIRVEVLYPPPELATSGPGGRSADGVKLTSNAMCAAIRLRRGPLPMVLFAGDVDQECLDFWSLEGLNLKTRVLVFPHHGGRPGEADTVEFATRVCRLVQPAVVLFSIHRSRHRLPLPEVVRAVRETAPGVRIACTQLSEHCAVNPPNATWRHLQDLPAKGRASGTCCAGTMLIDLSGSRLRILPLESEHQRFIAAFAPSALCRRGVPR